MREQKINVRNVFHMTQIPKRCPSIVACRALGGVIPRENTRVNIYLGSQSPWCCFSAWEPQAQALTPRSSAASSGTRASLLGAGVIQAQYQLEVSFPGRWLSSWPSATHLSRPKTETAFA